MKRACPQTLAETSLLQEPKEIKLRSGDVSMGPHLCSQSSGAPKVLCVLLWWGEADLQIPPCSLCVHPISNPP